MDQPQDTILLVEDDPASRKLIRTILGKRYRIIEAEDLEQARAALAQSVPGLMLVDMRLKDGDGLDLVRSIRADPHYPPLQIAAVTAQAMRSDESRILEAGCNAYFSKPIDTRRLSRVVDELMQKDRARGNA